MTIIALLIATAIPAVVFYVIHTLDLYRTGSRLYVVLSVIAGLAAYVLAAQVNPLAMRSLNLGFLVMVGFVAPISEEILKSLMQIYLVRRPDFNYFVDGAIYGFATGIAFAIAENFEYVLGNAGAALWVAITRVISTNLMHAAACAIVGIILGWARFQKNAWRYAFSAGGILVAILFHMGFNNLVTRVNSGLLLLYAVIVGGGAAGIIALVIRRGLKEELGWIKETLGVTDRVERQEVAAVGNMARVDEVLKRLSAAFGAETASRIENLLLVQARLGIQRKMAEKMADEKMQANIRTQIEQLQAEMEAARKEIGSYAMVYLRYTHLEEVFSVYNLLDTRIKEQASQPRGPGMGVFDRLKDRTTTAQDE